ncbi:hypothetical protein [Sphingomicrobium clamense]|uniref:Uncharacterized protein n=1 Tax=Sphingomicrobium clamense TaxID=2851013 RepID=A0ABS6V519_9SPHN|nr:hypothetical protein [Sphingomicrobium sp. B8]MBW0144651.1 hypothetical protein [Sphingomicrobium sp. B8]
MWHWLVMGGVALFAGASASRKAKQRIAEQAWHQALPRRLGLMLVDLDRNAELRDVEQSAKALAGSAVFTFYEAAGVQDFAGLMTHLRGADSAERQRIESAVVGKLVDGLPIDADPIFATREIRRALNGAGQEAMNAARKSKHL